MTADNGNPGMAVAAPKPRLLQQVRDAIRRKHYSPRTEEQRMQYPAAQPADDGTLLDLQRAR